MGCENDGLVVRRELSVAAAPDELWRAISEPGELRCWLVQEADIDLVPGRRGRLVDDDGVERVVEVEAVEAGRRVAWRWWPRRQAADEATRVVLTVEALGDGTGSRLVVVEAPAASAAEAQRCRAEARAGRAAGWSARLDRLALVLDGAALVGASA